MLPFEIRLAHDIIGITKEGHKEGLSFAIYPIKSASNYREILQDLKSRGLEDIVLFVSDELTKLKHTLNDECPLSKHQSYWTHIIRNIANKVRVNNKSPLLEDLKEAILLLENLFDKWADKYPKVKEQFPHETSLEKYVYTDVSKYNTAFSSMIHKEFGMALYELSKLLNKT